MNLVDQGGESWYFDIESGSFYRHIDDDDDTIYMITKEQNQQAKESDDYDSSLQSLRDRYSNSFGQMIAEKPLVI